MGGVTRPGVLAGLGFCLSLLLIAALTWLPGLITAHEGLTAAERLDLENGVRQSLIQLAAVVGAGIGGAVGLRTYSLNRQSAVTARLQQGVAGLASSDQIKRRGAILALGRVARESKEDHWQVIVLLVAHLKAIAPRTPPQARGTAECEAILSVLQTRRSRWESASQTMDLSELDLSGLDLRGGDLRSAVFRGSDLQGAHLSEADLRCAILSPDVTLVNAHLRYADLRGADLRGAALEGADLRGCDLRDAKTANARWGDQINAAGAKGLPSHLQARIRTR